MSLEVTSKVTTTPKTSYDQKTGETIVTTPNLTKIAGHGRIERNDRNLTSKTERKGDPKKTVREGGISTEKKSDTTTTVGRTSIERANIGFSLSFSIPLTGIIPTSQGGNC